MGGLLYLDSLLRFFEHPKAKMRMKLYWMIR
ncbi:hypothetical protein A35E_00624 [secondary endosymbiont of Heteropsylla cubana]|uniref:Uncharacterized protein n=1 Tax=secondary endosymbiont of Heteropsylla cubana TaxID=134287 RepID=J7GWQ9_9ENTR|nr:hypothetical protein A35E_00624 [secondary endosymbiont of Heteropsylla cubana]